MHFALKRTPKFNELKIKKPANKSAGFFINLF